MKKSIQIVIAVLAATFSLNAHALKVNSTAPLEKNNYIETKLSPAGDMLHVYVCTKDKGCNEELLPAVPVHKLQTRLKSENFHYWLDSGAVAVAALVGGVAAVYLSAAMPYSKLAWDIMIFGTGATAGGGATYSVTDIWNSPLEHREVISIIDQALNKDVIFVDNLDAYAASLTELLENIRLQERGIPYLDK